MSEKTRDELIRELHEYFQISELVCDHTHSAWGERSWQFLDTNYLACLLIIRRDILQAPMVCNHDEADQRGLRCNRCELVKDKSSVYLSSHVLGKAGDFTVRGLTAQEARSRIRSMAHLLPCPIRLEGGVNWLHFDVLPQFGITDKVYEFTA
jgi:hypothetical protein